MVIFNHRVVILVADELKFELGLLIREYNYNCIQQFERKQAQLKITCLSAKHAIEMQLYSDLIGCLSVR